MAVLEKTYPLAPFVVRNGICDVMEYRKARHRGSEGDSLVFETDMYAIKTRYTFHISALAETTTHVVLETEGVGTEDEHNLRLMLDTLDAMLEAWTSEVPHADDTAGKTERDE